MIATQIVRSKLMIRFRCFMKVEGQLSYVRPSFLAIFGLRTDHLVLPPPSLRDPSFLVCFSGNRSSLAEHIT